MYSHVLNCPSFPPKCAFAGGRKIGEECDDLSLKGKQQQEGHYEGHWSQAKHFTILLKKLWANEIINGNKKHLK
jgi:hypothetical protein